jgi:hypothetical protein
MKQFERRGLDTEQEDAFTGPEGKRGPALRGRSNQGVHCVESTRNRRRSPTG